jgi:RimJ/RimL family protein N-acetyltransferase
MELVTLPCGTEIGIRPITPDDGRHLQAAYVRLSPTSQYQRFLTVKPRLSTSELQYLTHVDGIGHVALIATPTDHPNFILGVGRYVRLPDDAHSAELGIVVGDAWQRSGIAAALLERLSAIAAKNGIERLTATMLADNVAAHKLMHKLGAGRERKEHLGSIDEVHMPIAVAA